MNYFLRTDFEGDQNVGLHGFATDKYCFIGNKKYTAKLKELLKVKVLSFPLLNMDLVRIFCTGNSKGVVIPKILEDFDEESTEQLRKHFNVLSLNTRSTSVGNLILMNDNGAIVSPMLRKHKTEIQKFFDFRCEVSTIAGMNIVGNLGFATNKGCVTHPKLKEAEKKLIEKILKVDVDIGTVNFGSPYPGAGIIGNSKGFVVSKGCSGPEMGRITDVLGFL